MYFRDLISLQILHKRCLLLLWYVFRIDYILLDQLLQAFPFLLEVKDGRGLDLISFIEIANGILLEIRVSVFVFT